MCKKDEHRSPHAAQLIYGRDRRDRYGLLRTHMSLLCTTRFDPFLETFDWNNAPDGTPSPYLLLAYQFDRLVSSARLSRWTVPDSFDYTALTHICDEAVRKVNGADGRDSLKVIVTPVPCQVLTRTWVLDTRHLPTVWEYHCIRFPCRTIAL